tara:strand:- start:597 stop:803 length:207 start_codon:yes stop_codon:yes gene_type:complete
MDYTFYHSLDQYEVSETTGNDLRIGQIGIETKLTQEQKSVLVALRFPNARLTFRSGTIFFRLKVKDSS